MCSLSRFVAALSVLLCCGQVFTQNLIPNPSFESLTEPGCPESPDNMLPLAAPWYNVSEGADLYVDDCSQDYIVFRDQRPDQAENGLNFASSWAGLYAWGLANGDVLGVELAAPLEEKLYYFSTYVYNRGTINPSRPGALCNTKPGRQVGLYLSDDVIYSVDVFDPIDPSIFDSYIEADFVWADSSRDVRSFEPVNYWFQIGGCIRARGGEKHLAVAPLFGKFEYDQPCAFSAGETHFQTYYYDFDQLSLTELPASLRLSANVCREEGTLVNVASLITDRRLEDAEIRWPDGALSDERLLMEEEVLALELVFPCGAIPLQLDITSVQCENQVYTPNAFSPNFDGVNDTFAPLLDINGTIQSYRFAIYDRWGQLIFQSNDPNLNWDGMKGSKSASQGVYVWQLDIAIMDENGPEQLKEMGMVTLIR